MLSGIISSYTHTIDKQTVVSFLQHPERVCHKVSREVCELVPQHKCVKVPVEKCKVTKVEVPKEMCETRDMEKCFKVPTQTCRGMTRQDTESRLGWDNNRIRIL